MMLKTIPLLVAMSFVMSCSQTEVSSENVSIVLNINSIKLSVGETYQLNATVRPDNAQTIVWSSVNADICSVSETGLVTAVSPGETLIVAKVTDNSASASCFVHVENDNHDEDKDLDIEMSDVKAPGLDNENW